MFWRPERCEIPGCKGTTLSYCGACKCVKYCSKEHQVAGWPEHKRDCEQLRKHGIWAKFTRQEDQMAVNPLGDLVLKNAVKKCGLCNREPGPDRPLKKTPCCKNWVCDNEHQYVMMSNSRQFCARSHNRYTSCGCPEATGHKHDNKKNDWRACKECRSGGQDNWYNCNGYNFSPMFDAPYGRMSKDCVDCGAAFFPAYETYSTKDIIGQRRYVCEKCTCIKSGMDPNNIPASIKNTKLNFFN
ncbi:hypothetical protein SAMD00019534_082280 [Acytostelium subglobosum LB1]|uniref:hypothetical protein n=1 Tax=Acytostelium subglobosum LB1 TaxID=1410327 RepID=UPI000644BEFD|nr:hypothetical protein SAMD00019534_082280 [Acytostelium subglobosum LB1]GAM25053.1 hypothetical protein SAMD00019534_082280 [Acytostelium subglobosum LB1]|eukprot:XP_012752142.1 hypothetical protein SAMD00019534_082280 [Acytostelium subglobosum LB1]